jgi:CheY-like chemotaxis protein
MSHSNQHIMVVEDDETIRDSLIEYLADRGYQTKGAADGQQALAALTSDPVAPCLIVLDLMMPVMDGWTFRAEQMRDPHLAQIPVVVVSAVRDVAKQVKDLGLIGVLKKPIDLPKLLAIVSEHCCSGGQSPPSSST